MISIFVHEEISATLATINYRLYVDGLFKCHIEVDSSDRHITSVFKRHFEL